VESWGIIMNFSYLLWLLGVAIALVVGVSVFAHSDIPYVMDWLRSYPDGTTKALFVALGLVALSKLF
jgi:hypothetical protein